MDAGPIPGFDYEEVGKLERESIEVQLERIRDQLAELRRRMDELTRSAELTARARERIELARRSAAEIGRSVAERRGTFIPIGTLLIAGLALLVLVALFPQRMETIREMWRKRREKME